MIVKAIKIHFESIREHSDDFSLIFCSIIFEFFEFFEKFWFFLKYFDDVVSISLRCSNLASLAMIVICWMIIWRHIHDGNWCNIRLWFSTMFLLFKNFEFFEFFENQFRKITLKSALENEFHYNKILSTTSDMYLYGREDRLWIHCFTEKLCHETFSFFFIK